jgi:hypothetical protein
MIETKSITSKRQLIEEIRQFNTSVEPKFLEQFDAPALQQYLEHLKAAKNKETRIGGWVHRQPKLKMVS